METYNFNKFAETQKNLRQETAVLVEQAVDRAWGDLEEFPRLLNVLERFNMGGDTLGGGSTNALLLYAQRPMATQLGSFDFWKEQGTALRKGEKAIKILVRSRNPKSKSKFFYNVEHRFDVSQTHHPSEQEETAWMDELDMLDAIIKTRAFAARYDENLPDGVKSTYIPELREVRVQKGQDARQMCGSLLFEFCHYQQARQLGADYERNSNTNFVALCGEYVLARRFGVDVGEVLFQKEVFPLIEAASLPERVGAVKNYLSQIIRTTGAVTREIQRGIYELERDCGQIIARAQREPPAMAI